MERLAPRWFSVQFSYNQPTLESFIRWVKCNYSAEGATARRHNECDINSPHKPAGVSKGSTITEERKKGRGGEMTMERDRGGGKREREAACQSCSF